MKIIFAGSKGKTGSVVFNYLKQKGYKIDNEVNINETPLKDLIEPSSIVIDFTNSETALSHANICLSNKSHFICGTTGINKKDINNILSKAQKLGLSFSFQPNFSLGIPHILNFLDTVNKDYKVAEITESHHISKKDLPSGTALLLKNHLHGNVKMESIRTTYPSLDHCITLKSKYEEITITHHVKNKLAYAIGVEKCLKELIKKLNKNDI